MLRYIIVRTIWIFIVLVAFLSILFTTIKLVPEYPPTEEKAQETYYARQFSDGYMTTFVIDDPQEVKDIRNNPKLKNEDYYYKDEGTQYRVYVPVPLVDQYIKWIKNIVTDWNWGVSTRIQVNKPVFDIFSKKLPVTLRINIVALFVFMPVGFILGIIAALKKNKLTDNLISLGVMIFISVPNFVVVLMLLMIFGYQLHWLPTQFPPAYVTGPKVFTSLVIPVLSLSFGAIAGLTRTTRAELTEVLTSEFLLLARTKGLTKRQAVIRHAVRNSMVPLVPGIIFAFVFLLSGSVIVERIYNIPGMGRVYLEALTPNNFDYNMILALSAFYTFVSLFAVLLVDLSYGIVDPRIRMGARK